MPIKLMKKMVSCQRQSKQGEKTLEPLATASEVFSFAQTTRTKCYLIVGWSSAILSGLCFPAMAWIFSNSFSDLAVDPSESDFMDQVRSLSFRFIILGIFMCLFMTLHATLLETASNEMTNNLKTAWFQSLLRQDMAYYDITDISGTATIISTNGMKFKMGTGQKLGVGVQFFSTLVGGIVFSLWSSWRVTVLMFCSVMPLMALSFSILLRMNRTQTARANESYSKAGSVVYTSVTSIRTILSLNAVEEMIEKFTAGTQEAFEGASSQVVLVGAANGAAMGSFLLTYLPLILYGGYLVYESVRETGCDPSGAVPTNEVCQHSASGVFGAMMGVTFGGAALPQVLAAVDAFSAARAAAYPALVVMNRKSANSGDDGRDVREKSRELQSRKGSSIVLPKYSIDSSSRRGSILNSMAGNIKFNKIKFAYPTRPETPIIDGFSLDIPAGKTVALVGPSGGGKSTIVSLIQRFYDPLSGAISLDGEDLTSINVKWLRQQIGIVSQEPKLFSMSIRDNIKISYPEASQEEVEEAAKRANAHDFIMSFPDGYDTPVGHEGAQLSGGQKQRVAISRALIRKPRVLLLDEATSALDSESEAVVQEALDKIMVEQRQTVIIIAHRLSTIRNAEMIVFIEDGKVVEQGTHQELIAKSSSYFKLVEAVNERSQSPSDLPPVETSDNDSSSSTVSESISMSSDSENEGSCTASDHSGRHHIAFKDVHFHYPCRPTSKIFKGLNLVIHEGETLALVGPSGQGKSTIMQLLESFYHPTSGEITYHGVDMKEINVDWLRKQFGLVSQEPTLFHTTIAENIRFGMPNVTQDSIEEAARAANAHDFIMSFPNQYNTIVGSTASTQVSGGEKQRIAIARALVRKPTVLLLDEATSALDNKSERVVQEALDKIMADKSRTTIVIAHRLSTIKNADRIAVINRGKVSEVGTHEELMISSEGMYRHLQSLQNLDSTLVKTMSDEKTPSLKEAKAEADTKSHDGSDDEPLGDHVDEEKQNARKARMMSKGDYGYFFVGSIGAILAGLMFPGWGFIFAYMIELLYQPVLPCNDDIEVCQAYWDLIADDMQALSFRIAYGLVGVISSAVIGHALVWYGFGTASERVNKRVRDAVFKNLLRQEVSWFDTQSVGSITTRVSEDAALIHTFSGEPLRVAIMNISSVFVGVVASFVYMWPFACVALLTIPFMAFAARTRVKMFLGEDDGAYTREDENSSGGIIVETLANIRTVASLTVEERRSSAYLQALRFENPNSIAFNMNHASMGLGQLIRVWGIALFFWWGGWLLHNLPNVYTFRDFMISMFSLLFSISGMAVSMQGTSDPRAARAAADRIFELVERQSAIDPLSKDGKIDV